MLQSFVVGNHFYITEEQAKRTPSRADNISVGLERRMRTYGCELIQEGAILLNLPQITVATGTVLFHRFYSRASIKKFNCELFALASLYLAAKVEEEHKQKMRNFLSVFLNMKQRREGLPLEYWDITTPEYAVAKEDVVQAERRILRELGFVTHVEHPLKFISSFLNFLNLSSNQELSQTAWNLLNDSMRTDLCIRVKPEAIACGCIYMAARKARHPLPADPPWWNIFDVEKEKIELVCSEILRLFTQPRTKYVELCPKRAAAAAGKKAAAESAARTEAEVEPRVSLPSLRGRALSMLLLLPRALLGLLLYNSVGDCAGCGEGRCSSGAKSGRGGGKGTARAGQRNREAAGDSEEASEASCGGLGGGGSGRRRRRQWVSCEGGQWDARPGARPGPGPGSRRPAAKPEPEPRTVPAEPKPEQGPGEASAVVH